MLLGGLLEGEGVGAGGSDSHPLEEVGVGEEVVEGVEQACLT